MRRAAPPRDIPPPLELECLKVLWRSGEATVRDVRQALASRNLAYTTVMTVLERLEKRGSVTRRKRGRSFLYTPKVTRETVRGFALNELIEGLFEGSEEEMLRYLRDRNRSEDARTSSAQ